jgi:DUF1680 family protein
MELELYNTVRAGISADGTRYFYVNPIEVWPEACGKNPGLKHVKHVRQAWYPCACCPPNVARLIASLGSYMYTVKDGRAYTHLYIGSEATLDVGGGSISITQKTSYPYEGVVRLVIGAPRPQRFSLCLRVPSWCPSFVCGINGRDETVREMENGYAVIDRDWADGDRIDLRFGMPVTLLRSHFKVHDNSGKAAIRRGPLVYCLEETDNGPDLHDITLAGDPQWKMEYDPSGTVMIRGQGRWR